MKTNEILDKFYNDYKCIEGFEGNSIINNKIIVYVSNKNVRKLIPTTFHGFKIEIKLTKKFTLQ